MEDIESPKHASIFYPLALLRQSHRLDRAGLSGGNSEGMSSISQLGPDLRNSNVKRAGSSPFSKCIHEAAKPTRAPDEGSSWKRMLVRFHSMDVIRPRP